MPTTLLLALIMIGCTSNTPKSDQDDGIVTPESLGISSQAIRDFIEAAETERPNDLHSFQLRRHGKIVAQGWWDPYDVDTPHMLYSLSKSFASTAIGIAQSEGLLTINDRVISFFPPETPPNPSENLKAMRIRDLLKMNTGHEQEPRSAREHPDGWVTGFLSAEIPHKPGTHFVYNSMATFMLSAIIQKVTGQRLRDYLGPRLFEPLDISEPTWDQNQDGIDYGGWGLYLRTEDIGKFGQLYLQKGKWEGKQLISEAWINEATSFQTSNGSDPDSDWEQGYGYQFWMCRHGLYRGDGAFGQFCIIMPEEDVVLAITAGTRDMQAIMNLAWEYLLPSFRKAPLEANDRAYQNLLEKTTRLRLTPKKGPETSPTAAQISGAEYRMDENDWGLSTLSFDLTENEPSLILSNSNGHYTLPLGFGTYKKGIFEFPVAGKRTVATSAAWTKDDTLDMLMYLPETPHGYNLKVSFDNEKIRIDRVLNVNFGDNRQEAITGTMLATE